MPDSQIQLQGTLLLADLSLRDGMFDRSVILLANHSQDEGALGLILNRPTGHEVGHFLKEAAFAPLKHVPVHIGGPVAREQLTFSAFWWNPNDGLHWQVRLPVEQAIQRAKQPGILLRAYVGYAGWTSGQLENELRRQSWFTTRPDSELLGRPHDVQLWSDLLRTLSPYHRILADAPEDPAAN